MFDYAIIGAGASGLVSAITLARKAQKVIILEKNAKIGKKLLATGNGKCNISNKNISPTRYHSSNNPFVKEILNGYDFEMIKNFFSSIGLELTEGKEGKIFPMSLQASSVVEILEYECYRLGVKILCNTPINLIQKDKNEFILKSNEENFKSKNLIIATGHLSAPMLGGVDDGLCFAKFFNHSIIPSFPALVQLTSSEPYLKKLSGVKIESIVTLNTKNGQKIKKSGDILFTHYGISGLAILDISREVMVELKHQKSLTLLLDFMPKFSHEQLTEIIKKNLNQKSSKPIEIWFLGFLHKKLIPLILEKTNLQNKKLSQISLKEVEKIVFILKNFSFSINGSNGYKGAEVATGGVSTKEINPQNLESKKSKGVYFVGEVLDVDGDRGGFNLHFAWVCGLKVGHV